jgi:PIN domain nuclease of toxin-antitoxin system
VRLLLDTHVFLWWRDASEHIGDEARRAIAGADVVFVSAASAWEVAIKVALGKLDIPGPLESAVAESDFEQLPITFGHAATLAGLATHHGDPFDRMLIAQALSEGLTIVTRDQKLAPYGAQIIWA